MKITILTYGSRGDVEPFLALAKGLQNAGHRVRLVAPKFFEYLVESPKIDFVGLPGEPQRLVQNLVNEAGKSLLRMVSTVSTFVVPLAAEVSKIARSASIDSDVIIHSFLFTTTGCEIARDIGIPDISAQLFPVFSDTAEFPAPTFPDFSLGGFYRRLTHKFVTQIFWQGSRLLSVWAKRKYPDLPTPTSWPFDARNDWQTPILYAFSSHVIPRPRDWRDETHITGYWFPDNHEEWVPDKELLDFIKTGPSPISIAFGSTVTRNLGEIYEKVLGALSISKQRGIIVGDWVKFKDKAYNIYQTDYVPYDWLFKRSAAVIHHGGAGTTGKGLWAGVPNIIVPFTSDQPFWGHRVCKLGAGPKPIPVKNLSVNSLSDAIVSAMNNQDMRKRAHQIGESIRCEDGVSQAVNIIQNYVQSKTG